MKLHLRLFALLFVLGAVAAVSLPTFGASRSVILVEGFTQWNCGPCANWNPQERAVLNAMTRDTVIGVKFHAWWPGSNNDAFHLWNVPENTARINYYGVNGVPTIKVDGFITNNQSTTALRTSVRNRFAAEAPCAIDLFSSPMPGDTAIHFTAIIHADADISNLTLYAVDITDQVTYASPPGTNGERLFDNVFRDMYPSSTGQSLTMSAGQIYTFAGACRKAAAWSPDSLSIVVWMQDGASREIKQAAWTHANGEYDMAVGTSGSAQAILGPDEGWEYHIGVMNLGSSAETYLVTRSAAVPEGWTCTFEAAGIPPVSDSLMLPLDSQQSDTVIVFVSANNHPGNMAQTVSVISPSAPGLMAVSSFHVMSGLDMLIVDDDAGATFENYYNSSASRVVSGHSWGTWDENVATLDAPMLDGIHTVVWFTGSVYPNTLSLAERTMLNDWLDASGNVLLLTGQGIGQDLRQDTTFFRDHLHAVYGGNWGAGTAVTGMNGDPVGDGLSFNITGGDGAGNQNRQTVLSPNDTYATVCMTYDADHEAALRVETPTYKLVYLGFGFEAISTPQTRDSVMARSLNWLWSVSGVGNSHEGQIPSVYALGQNYPNPFNPETTIPYALPQRSNVTLRVYDVLGRQVAELFNGMQDAGLHNAVWRASDFSSGVYFYRLEASAGDKSFRATHKLVVLK